MENSRPPSPEYKILHCTDHSAFGGFMVSREVQLDSPGLRMLRKAHLVFPMTIQGTQRDREKPMQGRGNGLTVYGIQGLL